MCKAIWRLGVVVFLFEFTIVTRVGNSKPSVKLKFAIQRQSRFGNWLPLEPSSGGVFLTQGWNPRLLRLLRWQAGSLPLVPPGKPVYQGLRNRSLQT